MHSFNKGISSARFPDILKMQRLNQFKEKSRIDKENYILPVSLYFSILPVISKICERLIFKQLIMFFWANLLQISVRILERSLWTTLSTNYD